MPYSSSELTEIGEWRERLSEILPVLRGAGSLWHRTSVASLKKIEAHGAIEPNTGQFPTTYDQSEISYGRYLGAVCLFDFDSEREDDVLFHALNWVGFLQDQGVATVLIRLDRDELSDENLLFHPDIQKSLSPPSGQLEDMLLVTNQHGEQCSPMVIPRVEVLHTGRIPFDAFQEYLLIKKGKKYEHAALPPRPTAISKIEEFVEAWSNSSAN